MCQSCGDRRATILEGLLYILTSIMEPVEDSRGNWGQLLLPCQVETGLVPLLCKFCTPFEELTFDIYVEDRGGARGGLQPPRRRKLAPRRSETTNLSEQTLKQFCPVVTFLVLGITF